MCSAYNTKSLGNVSTETLHTHTKTLRTSFPISDCIQYQPSKQAKILMQCIKYSKTRANRKRWKGCLLGHWSALGRSDSIPDLPSTVLRDPDSPPPPTLPQFTPSQLASCLPLSITALSHHSCHTLKLPPLIRTHTSRLASSFCILSTAAPLDHTLGSASIRSGFH